MLTELAVSTVYIDLPPEPVFTGEKGAKILAIGNLECALHEEVQAELRLVQEEIGFDYVYFSNLFSDSFAMTPPLSNWRAILPILPDGCPVEQFSTAWACAFHSRGG